MPTSKKPVPAKAGLRHWLVRGALLAGGLAVGCGLCELILISAAIPRYYKPHSFPPQFAFLKFNNPDYPVYVNVPSETIRFVYDGNPRGYFGPQNEVDQFTNSLGFRGNEFELKREGNEFVTEKPAGARRLVFLGDSFTFGEGVKFEDTYPEVTATLLRKHVKPPGSVRSYDLGVGGYNTTAELFVLRNWGGLALQPDAVVLGYVLNDAEGPLFEWDQTGQPLRVGTAVEALAPPATPPDDLLGQLHTVQLWRRWSADRESGRAVVDYYRRLYEDSSPGWQESRRALETIIQECGERKIPCYVVIFPMLLQLDDRYPFLAVHEKVNAVASAAGATVIDLFPLLKGRRAEDLWVHPVDQHPNEIVHRIAAEALAKKLEGQGLFE